MIAASYGPASAAVGAALTRARAESFADRLRDHDSTLWKPEAEGIEDRLGWLRLPGAMRKEVGRLERFAEQVRAESADVLVLGMGGSSLAADAFARIFGRRDDGAPFLRVVDTTDPETIAAASGAADPLRTLHIVSTKSGTTVETLSAFRYFFERVRSARSDSDESPGPGERFVAITDPGSPLAATARDRGFRDVFLGPADVGGRYSALSFFGLVPAALLGVDLDALLERAESVMRASLAGKDGRALGLGVALGALAAEGRDKLTLTTSPRVAPFADWVEQLVAESTGKEGTGIVPVVHEPLAGPSAYGEDRVFVDLSLPEDHDRADALAALERAGQPVIRLGMRDLTDLGGQFALWELATAFAGAVLGVNPFDQPDVEAAKERAREAVDAFLDSGDLPPSPAVPAAAEALASLVDDAEQGTWVALQAYLAASAETDAALGALRAAIRERWGLATTSGYGPRFLHSTGQLHKGGPATGLFVQLTRTPREDVPIPDAKPARGAAPAPESESPAGEGRPRPGPLTFGALQAAQAAGDRRALEQAGRRVLTLDVGPDAAHRIAALAAELRGDAGAGDGDSGPDDGDPGPKVGGSR